MKIWTEIIKEIKAAKTIILHRHVLPDGDAIGSQLALKELIKLNYPNKEVYAVGTMVDYLQFLGKMDQVKDEQYQDALVIVSDTANQPRIDDQRYKLAKSVIKIDHHPNNDAYGNYQWVDTSYPAACEMIADFIFANKLICSQFIAKCLLTGIITDTSRFMLRQISSRTFTMTSKLLDFYQESITNIYDEIGYKSINETKFLNYCYQNFQVSKKGIISLKITNKYLQQIDMDADKAAFHVNIFSNILGHPIWLVGIEYQDQTIRCELRTSDRNIKVNDIAIKFGGGGHNNAAGCKLTEWKRFPDVIAALETLR